MISKKYYKWIAEAIKNSMIGEREISLDYLMIYLDKIFLTDNRDFDLTSFTKDCGLEIDLQNKGYKKINNINKKND